MIPGECRRLAEVDFPLGVVSRHATREKSIRHGHPSTLHLWWARRPLAACRAMLMALLLPDPCDEHCPREFKRKAREVLQGFRSVGRSDAGLRKALLGFIGSFADWDRAADEHYLQVARRLVGAAHPGSQPLVVDPFAGGGSIPLEALRIGCKAFASDLNPVSCLILKVLLDNVPRHGSGWAKELRRAGRETREAVERELADLYPSDADGSHPIAYLWARTVRCGVSGCGAEIPLARSFWLCRKAHRKWALRHAVRRSGNGPPRVEFEVFAPKSDDEVPLGTVRRAKATCLCCGTMMSPGQVRAQLRLERGGADVVFDEGGRRIGGAKLLAVVTGRKAEKKRRYRLPREQDYVAVRSAMERLGEVSRRGSRGGLSPVPDEPIHGTDTRSFWVALYGATTFGDLFTARQKVALAEFLKRPVSDDHTSELLALAIGRLANASSSLCRWHETGEKIEGTFSRQSLPMVWDFCEGNPLSEATGGFGGALEWIARVVEGCRSPGGARVELADAADSPLSDGSSSVWFTDPPYYDAVPYADLSDFFFVWLKRVLPDHPLIRDPFEPANVLTPKTREAVQNKRSFSAGGEAKGRDFYERAMARAFAEGRRVLSADGVASVVFASKSTEGWEAMLSALIAAGWTVTGSWPISTEMGSRLRAQNSAALATSVHLVCRPRPRGAPAGDWAQVVRELPPRVAGWMNRLQGEGVRGADLVFACLGPALEIFSRYPRVETAGGRAVGLKEYLGSVWGVVARMALSRVLDGVGGSTDGRTPSALEDDARLTALLLWTRRSSEPAGDGFRVENGAGGGGRGSRGLGFPLPDVRRFTRPLGIRLSDWEGRIIEVARGTVRLLPVAERAGQLPGEERQLRATNLDRVHTAMLLVRSGSMSALRTFLEGEKKRRPEFLRLANALSALYPRGSEEKRLLDAMLLAAPR